jgi:hypothetical protein
VCIMVNIYALITKSVSTVHHRKFNEVQWFWNFLHLYSIFRKTKIITFHQHTKDKDSS